MSSDKKSSPLCPPESPVITITPPSLNYHYLPSPPLTPSDLSSAQPKSIPRPPSPTSTPPPIPPSPFAQDSYSNSLHYPLTRHLQFLHPNTPKEVIHFIATRLLSRDRPYGHTGDWKPVYEGVGDLSTAGVGMEATKGCKRKDGEGKEKDEKLEEMYGVAKESFRLLELKSPGVDKL